MNPIRRLPAAVLALALGGCIRGTLPARELYRLTPPDSVVAGVATASAAPGVGGGEGAIVRPVLDGTLAVLTVETPGLYGESGIVFRVGETEYGVYPSREWALPLGDMLGWLTARIAGTSALTRDLPLYEPPSPRAHTYLWRARVREFEEVNRGDQLLVAVRMEASVVRARDDSVVWSGSAARERPVTGGSDMPAVVRGLSAAAAAVIAELVERAERDLARAALPAAVPPAASAPRAP